MFYFEIYVTYFIVTLNMYCGLSLKQIWNINTILNFFVIYSLLLRDKKKYKFAKTISYDAWLAISTQTLFPTFV